MTSTEFRDELLALRADAARLLGTAGDDVLKASRERADAVTEQLKSALDELGQNLEREEKQIERLVAERPIAALACAFAVGILLLLASRRGPGQELTLASEIHDSAIDALQGEARATQSQVNRLLHHPLEGVLPLLVPLITAAINHLRKPAATSE